ncbi:hapless 2-like [Photinus pyralis]|uniref:hapless 2-like n=1 Tax=Photinus pyralis TaxID=7054 RepID=UPI0012672BF5|nr:hapless 2-like [Photinus pyralis]
MCCLKKLRCCLKEPRVEMRALLVKCTDCSPNESHQLYDFDKKEMITDCRKKLVLTLKLQTPSGGLSNSEYVVVDHVYDPISRRKARLLTPYVVKLKQEVINEVYPLQFLHVVNGLAHEDVHNKHAPNFTGCDVTSRSPTCSKVRYRGTDVAYSEGFCCSCNALTNSQRQPTPSEYVANFVKYGDPEFMLDGLECPRHLRARDTRNYDQSPEAKMEKLVYFSPSYEAVDKRQIHSSGDQARGGQNCVDRYTPPMLNPEGYHESAHCLKFSDVWYTVYRLGKPKMEHSVLVQIFERADDLNGDVIWKDLTEGKAIRVGTDSCHYVDEKRTLSIRYSSRVKETDPATFAINYKEALLLIPESGHAGAYSHHPEVRNGPSEYLIVHKDQVSAKGDRCNVAGVGFEAFARQPNRCSVPKGTCLSNQPFHLWEHDHKAEKLGKKGCFFLKNYGNFPENPIQTNPKSGDKILTMNHAESQFVMIDIEVRADFNTLLRPEGGAKITEVYIDSTRPFKTIITVKVTNSGLVSNLFSVRLCNCPLELPASFNDIEARRALIPPQTQHIFNLEIKCELPLKRFQCSVVALNVNREVSATRTILIHKFDRCFCTWHCRCACVDSSRGLKCKPMTLKQYHAAGFLGSLPLITVQNVSFSDRATIVIHLTVSIIMLLLLLGAVKGLIGLLCSAPLGIWGLENVMDLPKPIKHYFEADLCSKTVIYDSEGWPVHPETLKRVRCMPKSTEMILNEGPDMFT